MRQAFRVREEFHDLELWALLRDVMARTSASVLLEWDAEIPTFEETLAEALRASALLILERHADERRARRVHASRRDDERLSQRHRQRARLERDDAHRDWPSP